MEKLDFQNFKLSLTNSFISSSEIVIESFQLVANHSIKEFLILIPASEIWKSKKSKSASNIGFYRCWNSSFKYKDNNSVQN